MFKILHKIYTGWEFENFFLLEGWVLLMVLKMLRKTSILQIFVDNTSCNSVRAPQGLAAP